MPEWHLICGLQDHGFQNEENRFDFYRALEEFLSKHLGLR